MSDTSTGLLIRVRNPADGTAWTRLVTVYTPLLSAWLHRAGLPRQDADDLVQEVLLAVAREMPAFEYDRSRGSFRGWLRTILTNRIRNHQRARNRTPAAEPFDNNMLDALADPASDLSREWDREHDRHVAAGLLGAVRPEFGDRVWASFTRVVMDGERPIEVAAALGTSIDSVYQARSRVLARLREEAGGLLG
jgi:RNA polymerase sigma-70 factor (ECF subfamily)